MFLLAAIRNTGAYLSLAMKVRSSEYEVKDDKIHQRNQNIFLEIEAWISKSQNSFMNKYNTFAIKKYVLMNLLLKSFVTILP